MKKDQLEMKNSISDKNTLEGINNRLDEAEDHINNLEGKVGKKNPTQSEQKKNEHSLREIWNNMKCNNICIIGVPKGEESEQGIEN